MPHQCTNCGKAFADGSKQMLSGCPECGGNKFQFNPSSSTNDAADDTTPSAASPQPVDPSPATDDAADTDRGSVAETAAKARSSVREWVENRTPDDDTESDSSDVTESESSDVTESDSSDVTMDSATPETSTSDDSAQTTADAPDATSEPVADEPVDDTEDHAQASARSDVVTPEELSAARKTADAAREQEAATRTSPTPDETDATVIEPSSDDRPDLAQLREELNDQFESIKILSPGQYELNLMELYDRDEYIISLREDGRYVIEVADSWKRNSDDE